MRIRVALLAVACLAALAPILPARASSAGAETHVNAILSNDLTVKGYSVVIEVSDEERIAAFAPQLGTDADAPTPDAGAACVIAQRERTVKRMRTAVMESACPGRTGGFVFNPATSTMTVAGTVRTKTWTRIWRVIGNRWQLVKNQTVASTAVLNVRWVRAEQTATEPTFCGFGPGVERTSLTDVEGSVRFNGIGLTVTLPANTRGELAWSVCGALNPF